MPKGDGPFTAIVVVHEIFGVHEYIRDVCRRLAVAGYFAVAPDLYARQGDVTKMADREEIIALVGRVSDAQVFADLGATLAWAASTGRARPERPGITGFCWGGRIVWLWAARKPALGAGVAWYGRLQSAPTELQPRSPIDVAPTLRVPVLGLYGGKDAGIPLASIEQMQAALRAGTGGSEIVVYPEAQHGFHADYRPTYDAAAAADGWKRMLDWFARFTGPGAAS
jgi:carboxymethylenebutenolidase